jgi:hypothetical protein
MSTPASGGDPGGWNGRIGPPGARQILEIPTTLPGELWGIVSLFNPAGYRNKLENFMIFSEKVRRQGLPLLVVECAFGDAAFEVSESSCDRLVRRRASTVLWQKERLLNIGLDHLPDTCDKVAWLDADVILENDSWMGETARLLETYCVVQPFRTAHWLLKGETRPPIHRPSNLELAEGGWLPGMGYQMTQASDWTEAFKSYTAHGHLGFAWAVRREIIQRHGFYDAQVLGNGDFVMAHAMYGNEDFWSGDHWQRHRLSEAMLRHIERWGRPFFQDVRGSVFWVPGRILHLWHGSQEDRLYNQRLDVLKRCNFDPARDMVLEESGCWAWATDRPELREWSRTYFHVRREEGGA